MNNHTVDTAAPAARARLAPIDGLRGMAAMMVVLYHLNLSTDGRVQGVVGEVLWHLNSGVDLFFVLSGFCLYYPLTKPGSVFVPRTFFRRRALRIAPPYYAALAAIILLPPLIGPLARTCGLAVLPPAAISWQEVWTHLLFVHTLVPSTFWGINNAFWSLGLEVQFYLAFPLAVWLFARFGWGGMIVIAATTIAYRLGLSDMARSMPSVAHMGGGNPTLDAEVNVFIGRWLEFGLGMLIARAVRSGITQGLSRMRELAGIIAAATLYLAAQLYLAGPPDRWLLPVTDILYGLSFSILVLLACTPGSWIGRILALSPITWVGMISYSLYLLHQPILQAIGPSILRLHYGAGASLLLAGGCEIPLLLAIAAAFFWLFERPLLERGTTSRQSAPRREIGVVPATGV